MCVQSLGFPVRAANARLPPRFAPVQTGSIRKRRSDPRGAIVDQKIEALGPDEASHVERQRTWVRDHYEPDARHQYETVAGKLRLLDTVVRSNWIEPTETWKLQSLGVTLGDALAQQMGLSWVAVEDRHGRDPALRYQNTSVVVFPLTMISKRIERGETVDIFALFNGICAMINEAQAQTKGH
jgi:hypothetical protein